MTSNANFAEIAALAGDPARAGMLHALMDGRALTASELARVAGIAPQTASGHLTRMTTAGLLKVEKQGRHRYHRLASPGCCAHDGEHYAGRLQYDAAPNAAYGRPARSGAAKGPYVLRPPRR